MRSSPAIVPTAAAAWFLWLVPSLGPLYKHGGMAGLVAAALAAAVGIYCLLILARQGRLRPTTAWFVALCVVGTVLFVVLWPLANDGTFGPGSDRDEALDVALRAALAGRFPYADNTYLGNPPTPMPGALILALPFHLAGSAAWQNPVWLIGFVWWCCRFFQQKSLAWMAAALFVLACPASLLDFVVGGDYLVNIVYVMIAADLALSAIEGDSRWQRHLAYAFLAIAISSRPIYAVVPVVVAGYAFRRVGIARAGEFCLGVGALLLVLNLPFYLHDPARFPTRHVFDKVAGIPFAEFVAAMPVVALGVAAAAFVVPLRRAEAFGLVALALAVLMYPPALLNMVVFGWGAAALNAASYTLPVSLFAGLALLRRFERSRPAHDPAQSLAVTSP